MRGGSFPSSSALQNEWLWGWDLTPWIVSVWADGTGRATVWRRHPETRVLIREEDRFRPWLLLDRIDDVSAAISADQTDPKDPIDRVTWRELEADTDGVYFSVYIDVLRGLFATRLARAR